MPLVRIDMLHGRPPEERRSIGDAVQTALVETLDVPERDRFQIVTEHEPDQLLFDRGYLDVDRTDAFVLVQVVLAAGRTGDAKRRFYARLAELLGERVGVRPEDVGVVLVENQREDWSFGNGQASYVVLPRERWR